MSFKHVNGVIALASLLSYTMGVSAQMALEEVVVTAQKKSESLQDTPISLTAFSEDQLEKEGINGLSDLSANVPSMTVQPFPINNSTLVIYIRGVGLIDAQITQDPPVGVYMDGSYIARSTGLALDIADLQRIEVLRGPQGTLYGRNSTGGAINFVTQRPDVDSMKVTQKFTMGNRDLFTSKTSVNVPISDTAAAKLAYFTSAKNGFIENDGPGGDFGDRDVEGYRFDFSWDITDTLRLDYGYDKSNASNYNSAYQPVIPRTVNPAPANANEATFALLHASSQTYFTFSDKRVDSMTTAVPLEESFSKIEGHTVTLAQAIGDVSELKYIYAQRALDDGAFADLVASGTPEYRIDNGDYTSPDGSLHLPGKFPVLSQEQFSHELQFTSSFFDGNLDLIAGVYYFEEEADEDNMPLHHQFSGPLTITELAGLTTTTSLLNLNGQYYSIKNEAVAAFGRVTWAPEMFEDRLQLTLGLRHTEDSREAFKDYITETYTVATTRDANGNVVTALPPVGPAISAGWAQSAEVVYKDSSFDLIAEYDLTDDINLYAKYGEAYKAGGYNVRDPDQARFAAGFKPEYVASAEIGVKSELMDRRLRINADVFHSDYTDVQLNFLLPGSIADTQVENAGEAVMRGFEMDVTFLAAENLLLTMNYAYLDAEVTAATDPNTGADVADEFRFTSAPMHSYTATMDYTVANWSWGRLALNLSYNYMDDRDGSPRTEVTQRVYLDDYDLWNGRVGLYDVPLFGGTLTTALWGKNLADNEYVVHAVDNLPHADRAVLWGEPLSYGIDLIYRYE